jgi:hypothetical protein
VAEKETPSGKELQNKIGQGTSHADVTQSDSKELMEYHALVFYPVFYASHNISHQDDN